MFNKCYADAMGMHPCDYGCVCDRCMYDNVELVGGNNMSKYLVMYTYYDGCGRERAIQIRVYDEDMQEMDIR